VKNWSITEHDDEQEHIDEQELGVLQLAGDDAASVQPERHSASAATA
jgi:hypothetical protein